MNNHWLKNEKISCYQYYILFTMSKSELADAKLFPSARNLKCMLIKINGLF